MVTISKTYTFEAAHILPRHRGKCARLHGHSYRVEVSLTGPVHYEANVPDEGMVVDFAVLDEAVKPLIDMLDHRFIAKGDEWPCAFAPGGDQICKLGVRTTAENIAQWFVNHVYFDTGHQFAVGVRVWETAKSSAYATSEGELP